MDNPTSKERQEFDIATGYYGQVQKLKAEIEKKDEALRFYADEDNYDEEYVE